MASTQERAKRSARLNGLFRDVLSGNRQVRSSRDAQLFIEAIQNQQPPSECVEKIVASPNGLNAVRDAVRIDLTPSFICSHTLKLAQYLSDPAVKSLVEGRFLQDILLVIARPSTVWSAILKLFADRQIPDDTLEPFAWLTLQLLSLPAKTGVDILHEAMEIDSMGWIMKSEFHAVRELGYGIKKVLQIRSSPNTAASEPDGPGGRHDNDFADFRKICIYPTTDEFLSTRAPFYRTAKEVSDKDTAERMGVHLDNQYRLLREDMLTELREELQIATGMKKGKRRLPSLGHLVPVGLYFGDDTKRSMKKCCLAVECYSGLESLSKLKPEARKAKLKSEPTLLKHQSFGALCRGRQIYGFAFIERDIDMLSSTPPVLLLQFTDSEGLHAVLRLFFSSDPAEAAEAQFILVDTPVFAYEPVLTALKRINELPLHEALVDPEKESIIKPAPRVQKLVEKLRAMPKDINGTVTLKIEEPADVTDDPLESFYQDARSLEVNASAKNGSVEVDESQLQSLFNALTRALALIQGPPGTGKSFIGAQIVKCLYNLSESRILLISYTNHALDQFMQDLRDVGIPLESMVRLGSKNKCAPDVLPALLSEQKRDHHRSRSTWDLIDDLKADMVHLRTMLEDAFSQLQELRQSMSWEDIKRHLEFESNDFYDAFAVPLERNGWNQAGAGGKAISEDYLYHRWIRGQHAGAFRSFMSSRPNLQVVWNMNLAQRRACLKQWASSILAEHLDTIREKASEFNDNHEKMGSYLSDGKFEIIGSKRIVCCTTTAAATHSSVINAGRFDIIMAEEAGEILESHILAAMKPSVKQIIMIGDHKQLRPKINSYALTFEKGDGYDLNVSLFERLIRRGSPHTTLQKQHRMVPEISVFPRELTYPDLVDGPKTDGRPCIRGLRDRVVFVNHGKQEDRDDHLRDTRDPMTKSSKKNIFEAEMVLSMIKYFGQQGYGAEKMVILTPYLGQLRVLRDLLRDHQHDPELSELDKFELLRAGLVTKAAANMNSKPLRISTIDNYQGEESDIVIASLTRSNESGDIGFMSSPERLNVLITRARNCLVMIGNMATFSKSKKGAETWIPFFEILKANGHLYDGLPVVCHKHPETTALLSEPVDFDKCCPDGGCTRPCGAILKCGIHQCKFRCHRVDDHSKTECREIFEMVCDRKHKIKTTCGRREEDCRKCIQEDKEIERRIKRDMKLEEDRLEKESAYKKELQVLQDELEHQRRTLKYEAEEDERKQTLAQHKADLAALKETEKRLKQQKAQKKKQEATIESAKATAQKQAPETKRPAVPLERSEPATAKDDWENAKQFEGAKSAPLDILMDMIGLEDVKQEFLSVKFRVDTTIRQGVSIAEERFSCSLLGNPGTGKTTVARIYGQFLTSVGVIPGSHFKETTGSALANLGVSGCKKLIDDILNDGGGVLFIDEAYQLSSGNSPGGKAVMDYLLPEVENLRGKIVFILAGYSREMESFFSHNPGLPSRFPVEMKFADYNDDELLQILALKINKKYRDKMNCEDGLQGLYCRIVTRRIGRGRGKDGFGNARTVENILSTISQRQSNRLKRERRKGRRPDDLLFTKEDLIGPEPTEALSRCEAWKKLQSLIGLAAVKEAVKTLVDSIGQNYQRELAEQAPVEYCLNKVFLGSPGTGKTTVAKLYGEILVSLGLLSKGEVVVRNPADFVGSVLGQSEQQTKGILAATVGKVLVIDEAYGLYGGGGVSDPYKTAVIDTIVAEVQSVPGDDRCVLLLGYKDQMENMFQNVNPGLSRRFPTSSGFNFEDFTDDELRQILELKLKQQDLQASAQAKDVAMEILKRARNRPNFGNAGEIDIILGAAKERLQRRISKQPTQQLKTPFLPQDFDENFNRAEKSEANIRQLFQGTVGSEDTIVLLEGYQDTVRTMKVLEMDPKENIPFNFLFRGPPGTGKTTTARKMGQVFYDMGFLATAEVVECSATDLIGQYLGQTGPKVQQLLDKALGRVLFIDEAYRLAHDGHYSKEAIDELVDCTTKEKYHKKLIIILAGYEDDINRLMEVNSGLTSRFPEVINFRRLTPDECLQLLMELLRGQRARLGSKVILDLKPIEEASADSKENMLRFFTKLSAQKNWASARDVKTLSVTIFNKTIKSMQGLKRGRLSIQVQTVEGELEAMLSERAGRSKRSTKSETLLNPSRLQLAPTGMEPPKMDTKASTTLRQEEKEPDTIDDMAGEEDFEIISSLPGSPPDGTVSSKRDAGVSDEVWEQLQRDQEAEREREETYQKLQQEAKRGRDDARDRILRRLLEERRKAAELKAKLQTLGICPAGFAWIKQNNGYRCEGGGHFMSDKEVEAL